MQIGSKRSNSGDEYVFIDGKAMTASEAARFQLTDADTAPVPGQEEAASVPGAAQAAKAAGKGKVKGKGKRKWNAKKAFDELDSGDAFELTDEAKQGLASFSSIMEEDKRHTRRTYAIMAVILVLITAFNLCISSDVEGVVYSPLTVIQVMGMRIKITFGMITGADWYDPATTLAQVNQEMPAYSDLNLRFDITFVTIVCGLLLALSGMMYQNVFKNPIAAPSMLGVSAGVRIGTIILVVIYGTAAATMNGTRYVFCYIGGTVIILSVIGFSKLIAGKHRHINVVDMLIVGSVLSQVLSTVSMYFLTEVMDDELYEVFYEITSGARADASLYVYAMLAFVFLISVVPVFLMRFRMNATAFSDGEVRVLGVDPERLRVFVLIMGTVMILAAQIHAGVISMIALVVPFLVRYVVGSEFGKQMVGNMLLGPASLLLCRAICGLIPFVGAGLSLDMVVGFVALPFYIWMMALGRKGWE